MISYRALKQGSTSSCPSRWGRRCSSCPRKCRSAGCKCITRGQWPYIPASTWAMRNRHVMLCDLNYRNLSLKMASEVIWPQIWNQQPWLPWYPCAYCLQWPPRPWRPPNDLRGHDLRFEINNLDYPGIHVHLASNDLQGHDGLQTTSEVIWPQIGHQQPWLPWYPCAYYLQWPPSWWPLRLPMTSEVTSDLEFKLLDLENLCSPVSLASKCHYSPNVYGRRPNITHWPAWLRRR